MNLWLRILLALHLCGLAIMMGTTVVDYFTFRFFCSMTDAGDNRAQGLVPIMARYGELVRIGAVVLIFTGVIMFALKTDWWDQLWFKIKLALAVLLVLNGMFVGNSLGLKFRKMIVDNATALHNTAEIRTDLHRFYLVQLTLFFLIVLVSIIRPQQAAT